ncbi:MAG: FKBP-type peptidyl-prolyl cis-trans isomerase [Promethearchaeota archaeon]
MSKEENEKKDIKKNSKSDAKPEKKPDAKGKKQEDKKKEEKPEVKKEEKQKDKKEEKQEEKKPDYIGQPVKEGDLLKVDLLGRTIPDAVNSHVVYFQASNAEDAKKLPNYDPKKSYLYTPELVIAGKPGFLLDKLTDELLKMKYGEEKWVQLEPEDAFGAKKAENFDRMSYKKFIQIAGEKPRLGMEFKNKKTGKTGYVVSVDQGRIRVDYNHPLAGRKVEYRIKPLERIDGLEQKVMAFLERRLQASFTTFLKLSFEEDNTIVNIEVPSFLAVQEGLGYAEFSVSYEIQEYLGIEKVKFIHVFEKQPPAPTTPPPSGPPENLDDIKLENEKINLDNIKEDKKAKDDKKADKKEDKKDDKKADKKAKDDKKADKKEDKKADDKKGNKKNKKTSKKSSKKKK